MTCGSELADNVARAVSAGQKLERGYAALHNATMIRSNHSGSLTGVFLGFAGTEFSVILAASPVDGRVYAATGSASLIASG